MPADNPFVQFLLGSKSDLEHISPAFKVLEELDIPHRIKIASAHRTPDDVRQLIASAENEGCHVFIAAAGLAAHLAGAVAAHTRKPVIGIPVVTGPLQGVDALLSTAQMPPGVPVANTGVGIPANSAWLAARILALGDAALAQRVEDAFARSADKVRAQDAELNSS